jgi:hypothetical protein
MIDTMKLKQIVGELDEDSVNNMLDQFLASNPSCDDARKAVESCRQGMEIVGDLIFTGNS